MQNSYILSAVRTPIGKAPRGVFKDVRPEKLLAIVLKESVTRAGLSPDDVSEIFCGCAAQEGAQAFNAAHNAKMLADFPDSVATQTVNRLCGSGAEAIRFASQVAALAKTSSDSHITIGCGVESMSNVPMTGVFPQPNLELMSKRPSAYISMPLTAERVVAEYGKKYNITRSDLDQFALESHQKAINAITQGYFKDEIIPVVNASGKTVTNDEGARADTTLELLGKLKPLFKVNGVVTAGNASQTSDGAAALVIASEERCRSLHAKPLARVVGYGVSGVAAETMGIGPVAAIPKALTSAGLTLDQIQTIELNEAFAGQALAVMKVLELDPARVNPYGGAIATGHPLGASGAIRSVTLLHRMRRDNLHYGMFSACVGGGQGVAIIYELL
jgi:acetyl-CoA acyltransferase